MDDPLTVLPKPKKIYFIRINNFWTFKLFKYLLNFEKLGNLLHKNNKIMEQGPKLNAIFN